MTFAIVLLALAATPACGVAPQPQAPPRLMARVPENPDLEARYLFYLHGRIVEDQGPDAVSPEFGRYEYAAILERLAETDVIVVSEVRAPATDVEAYADTVASQIRHLIARGVEPRNVTVIGASKGSAIAMLVSTRLAEPVRYVLLASCNDYVADAVTSSLHGDVLSIYEASDPYGQSCGSIFERSPDLGERHEIRLDTGLRHGFLYKPLEAWVRPALSWARGHLDEDREEEP